MSIRNLLVGAAFILVFSPASAQTIYEVDTTVDFGSGPCTVAPNDCPLRGAITAANSDGNDSRILLANQIYQLTIPGGAEDNNASGDLDIRQPLEILVIAGASPVIEQTVTDRVIDIQPNSGAVRIVGPLMITGGRLIGALVGNGGGINASAHGDLELEDVVLTNNQTELDGGCLSYSGTNSSAVSLHRVTLLDCSSQHFGGGASLVLPGAQPSTITSSLVEGNTAYDVGGGLYVNGIGDVVILDTTISENLAGHQSTAEARGGGIYRVGGNTVLRQSAVSGNQAGVATTTAASGGGIHSFNVTSFLVENSTISGNRTTGTAQSGAGIHIDLNASATLDHASVVNNSTGGMENIFVFGPGVASLTIRDSIIDGGCSGHFPNITSSGFNVERPWNGSTNTTCNLTNPSDLKVTDLMLRPLAGYGGPTYTHALLPGSPAQLHVSSAQCQAEDQRHAVRQGLFCDAGAYDDSSVPPGQWIFADGFESGDTAAWSASAP